MKKLYIFLLLGTFLFSCTKEDLDPNNSVDVSDPNEVTASIKIPNSTVKEGNPPAPSDDPESPKIQDSSNEAYIQVDQGKSINLPMELTNGSVNGYYLQVLGASSYFDIAHQNARLAEIKDTTVNELYISIELPEELTGNFCVNYRIYDAENRISNVIEKCIEVKPTNQGNDEGSGETGDSLKNCLLSKITLESEGVEFLLTSDSSGRVNSISLKEGQDGDSFLFSYDNMGNLLNITNNSSYLELEVSNGKIVKKVMYENGKENTPTVEENFTYDAQGKIIKEERIEFYDTTQVTSSRTFSYTSDSRVSIQSTNYSEDLEFDDKVRPFNSTVSAFLYIAFEDALGYPLPGVSGNLVKIIGRETIQIQNTYNNERLERAVFSTGETETLTYSYVCQ